MGKIKKILETDLVGGTQQSDIYPVTSFKAVYDKNNERLDDVLRRSMPVNISTSYNEEHTAEVLTLEEAISKVPSDDRSLGFQATFISSGGWVNYRFDGQSLSDWSNLGVWTQIATLPEVQQSADEVITSLSNRQNIIDSSKYLNGYYLNDDNGVVVKNSSFVGSAISGYSIVKPDTTYKTFNAISNVGLYSIHFYDINMNWISKAPSIGQFTTPVNAYYINVCWLKSSGDFSFEDVKASTVIYDAKLPTPTEYVPYDRLVLKDYLISDSQTIKDIDTQLAQVSEGASYGKKYKEFESVMVAYGPNLLNKGTIIRGKYVDYSSTVNDIANSVNPENGAISDYIPVEPDTQYTVQFGDTAADKVILFCDNNLDSLKDGVIVRENPVTFTTSSSTKYVVISFGNISKPITDKMINGSQMVKGDVPSESTSYISLPDYIEKPDATGDTYLDTYLDSKNFAKFIKALGKNLFDKSKVIDGFYISTTDGVLSKNSDSAVSPLIPIREGGVYHIERPCLPTGCPATFEIRFVGEDGTTPIKPLNADGSERDSYSNIRNAAVKAPEGARYLQCTIKFVGKAVDYDSVQIEEGEIFTGYEPYTERYIIDYPNLPQNLSGLSDRVGKLEKSSSLEIINVANSDKIGFFSNSFLNGYCMLGKHAINNLSMFSDYIMYNYGHSGDDVLELLHRVNSNESWLGDIPVQKWGIKYGVIAMQDNDGALFAAASDTYYQNAKKLAEAIKAMGGIPILSTEHDNNNFYYNFARLAQEEGYMMMNWGYKATKLFVRVFAPFWYNSHPSTRTAWMWTYGMQPYLDTLPRPNKAIKLFRVRAGVDTGDLQNLIYEDFVSRAERFEELTCGVSGLTEATDKYFDRMDGSQKQWQTYKDEYQMIQNNSAVTFGNHALIEVVTPYDRNGISGLSVSIAQTGVSNVYIKKTNSLANPLPKNRVVAFGITAGEESMSKGTTFNITGGVFNENIKGEYTVEDIVNGIVVTTTSSTGKTTSGTDNPICDIEGVTLKGSYDYPTADYMLRYNKPLGEWAEVTANEDGTYTLDEYLSTCMMYDKIALLLKGDNISISDIQCQVSGNTKKNGYSKPLVSWKNGTSMLTDILLDDDTSWSNVNSLPKYEPVASTITTSSKEPLPTGVTTVRKMSEGDTISQALVSSELSNSTYEPFKIQIRVVARYFPEYIDTDEKWGTSELKRGTFDCAKLAVMIGSSESDANPVKVGEIPVGAWWNEFTLNSQYYTGTHLILKCLDKHIQIAKVELVKVE